MYLEDGLGYIEQAHLLQIVIYLCHSELNSPLSCGLDGEVPGLSECSRDNPLKHTTHSGNVENSSPLVPNETPTLSSCMVCLPHPQNAGVAEVESVKDILAVIFVPEGSEVAADALVMIACLSPADSAYYRHLLQ